jgi:hypothetical protein
MSRGWSVGIGEMVWQREERETAGTVEEHIGPHLGIIRSVKSTKGKSEKMEHVALGPAITMKKEFL